MNCNPTSNKYKLDDPEFCYNKMFNSLKGKKFEIIDKEINLVINGINFIMEEFKHFNDEKKYDLSERINALNSMKNYFNLS